MYGVDGGPHSAGATVAVTIAAPSCSTTCGADNVNEQGGGGSAEAGPAPARPANGRAAINHPVTRRLIMPGW